MKPRCKCKPGEDLSNETGTVNVNYDSSFYVKYVKHFANKNYCELFGKRIYFNAEDERQHQKECDDKYFSEIKTKHKNGDY